MSVDTVRRLIGVRLLLPLLMLGGARRGGLLPPATALQADWVPLQPAQRVAPRRSGHAAFVAADGRHYVFGGYVEEDGAAATDDGPPQRRRYVSNDLWRWAPSSVSWYPVEQSGDVPRARLVAAVAVLADTAYLFGGWDPGTEGTGGDILDDVHALDLQTHRWRTLPIAMPDGACSRHVAVACPKQGVILVHNHRCVDFVYLFDPASQSFRRQSTTGPCPSPRGLHAATAVSDSAIMFFGGAAQDGTMSNEAFLLDLDTWTWRPLPAFPDSPRAAPCLCRATKDSVVAFGGAERAGAGLRARGDVWAFRLGAGRWERLVVERPGVAPPPRNAASLAPVGDGLLLLTGGWTPFQETWDDAFALRVVDNDD